MEKVYVIFVEKYIGDMESGGDWTIVADSIWKTKEEAEKEIKTKRMTGAEIREIKFGQILS